MLAVISWVYHTCSRAKLSNNGSKTRTFMVRPLDVVFIKTFTHFKHRTERVKFKA